MNQIVPTGERGPGPSIRSWRLEKSLLEHPGENCPCLSPALCKTILIADDDASVRQMLGRVFESEHYTVVGAQTGREAAAIFLAAPPDLVRRGPGTS